MSDAKRPGGKDISDLKARLGLKKGAAGAAAPATGQTQQVRTNGGGGVVAPPGLNLPPPPGMSQPVPTQPAAPAIPNAADDPFGAMNAMAAVGTVQRAPEIVIVNDGKPVENVGTQSKGATIAKIAVPAVLALGIGLAIGRVSKDANYYNDGLRGSKALLGDAKTSSTVVGTKAVLSELDTVLEEVKGKNYRPDPKTGPAITAIIKKLEIRTELPLAVKHNAELGGRVLSFYAGVAELKAALETHNKFAKFDEAAFKTSKEKQDAATLKANENAYLAGQPRYAVVVQAPTEGDKSAFGAKLVEIAGVNCGDSKAIVPKCGEGESPRAWVYRTDPGGVATETTIAEETTDAVPTKKMVKLLDSGVRDALIKGNEPGVSELYYSKRLRSIAERTTALIDEANKLQQALQAESNKGSRFSFFL